MTTYSFSGYAARFEYDALFDVETIVAVEEVQLVVVADENAQFSYTFVGNGVDNFEVDMNTTGGTMYEMFYEPSWGLTYPGDYDNMVEMAEVTFNNGDVSTLMQMTIFEGMEGFIEHGTMLLFHLDGDALPSLNSIAAFEAFSDTITSLAEITTGALVEGNLFTLYDLNPVYASEDDELYGYVGRDVLKGGSGDDLFHSSRGNDVMNGGSGFDVITYGDDNDGITANLATGRIVDGWGNTDRIKGIEGVAGTMFEDTFIGNAKGNLFAGGAGADSFDGGRGSDTLYYEGDAYYGGKNGITVKLNKGFAIDGFGDRDTFTNMENIIATNKRDILVGNGKGNEISGGNGNDVIKGLGGSDFLEGGNGNDVLFGGKGADVFEFSNSNFGNDVIRDFRAAQGDTIHLHNGNIDDFADLMANHIAEVDGDLVITDNSSAVITIRNAELADVTTDWFVF